MSKLFIIAGSSGAGKTTLVREIIAKLKDSYNYNLGRVVTYTTKVPRVGELSERDYYYIDQAEFKAKIVQNFFLEWSCVYGAYYGSPRDILAKLTNKQALILIVDQAGVSAIYNFMRAASVSKEVELLENNIANNVIYVWIETSLELLEQRLRTRSTESEADLQRRLSLAQQEILLKHEKLNTIFNYSVLNNNCLELAISDLERIFVYELALK